MLDVNNLERRWIRYKFKKVLPYILFFFGIAIVLTTSLIWHNHKSQNTQSVIVQTQDKSFPQHSQSTLIVKENTTILEPSMEFVQNFQTSPISEEIPKQKATNIPKQPNKPTIPTTKPLEMPEYPEPIKTPSVVTNQPPSNKTSLSINRNESQLDIETLKIRFKDTSNAHLGLFIAQYYYDHGEYNEAYNYALKTNSINSRIDGSWIVFSKSLVKLGKVDQAKKTLQLYLSQSNSEAAKALLDSIERGSFK